MKHRQRILSLVIVMVICLAILPDASSVQAAGSDDFVITVKTDEFGYSTDNQFTIPTAADEIYNYNVDCNNNGSFEVTGADGDFTCEHPHTGTYTIRIQDNAGDGTGFPRIAFTYARDGQKLLSVEQWGAGKWTSMEKTFMNCTNMVINAVDAPNLSLATSMEAMFWGAKSLNSEIWHWDTSMNHQYASFIQRGRNLQLVFFSRDVLTCTFSMISEIAKENTQLNSRSILNKIIIS